MNEAEVLIHKSRAKKDASLPECGDHDRCPTCNRPLENGFGVAGGGYGVYTYCLKCSVVTSKTEVDE